MYLYIAVPLEIDVVIMIGDITVATVTTHNNTLTAQVKWCIYVSLKMFHA